MPNNNPGRSANSSTGTGRVPPFLSQPVDLFSRTFRDLFGGNAGTEEAARPAEKIQPVVPTLYPTQAPPEPPKPVAPPLRFDPRTKALLTSLSESTSEMGAAAAELGKALLQCEEAPMTQQDLARYRGAVQRLTLVARMIDAVESDPCVPEGFRRAFDRLRFTLIKSALADQTFLTHRGHPLRAIAARLAMRAASSRRWDETLERELVGALNDAVRDFDLSANFVRPMLKRLQPLELEVIREFMQQVQAERTDRQSLLAAQQQVDQEIARRLQGAVLDARLRFVIEEEWKEVLLSALSTHGPQSGQWRAAVDVAEELLRQAPALQSGAELPKPLRERIESGLLCAGRDIAPVMAAFESLRETRPAPETIATEFARVAMRLSPLSRLMEGGRWFRVFDHGQQKMRWLQGRVYDPQSNTVTFADMDGSDALVMHAQQFLEDLKRGLSSPNQPDEETNDIVTELRAAA